MYNQDFKDFDHFAARERAAQLRAEAIKDGIKWLVVRVRKSWEKIARSRILVHRVS